MLKIVLVIDLIVNMCRTQTDDFELISCALYTNFYAYLECDQKFIAFSLQRKRVPMSQRRLAKNISDQSSCATIPRHRQIIYLHCFY